MGWDGKKYVHGAVIHAEVIEDKIWIHYDGTEDGIANDLIEAGIPRERIVLGFRSEKIRPFTGFAVG